MKTKPLFRVRNEFHSADNEVIDILFNSKLIFVVRRVENEIEAHEFIKEKDYDSDYVVGFNLDTNKEAEDLVEFARNHKKKIILFWTAPVKAA